MKKILYLILVLICVVSCQNKYSEPEIEMPMYALEDSLDAGWEIKTIEEFQLMNNSEVPYQVTEKYLMKGIVTADDESGNIYKSIYIQDETGQHISLMSKKYKIEVDKRIVAFLDSQSLLSYKIN